MRTMRALRQWASFSCIALALLLAATQYVGTGRGSPPAEPLQVEEGREAFGQACVQCHGLSRTQIQRKTADRWRDTVYSMISRGAPVMPDEIEPLIDYLAATYGPGATPPAGIGEGSQGGSALPDGPGRAIFVGNCAACHSLELPLNMRQSEAEWNATISQMVSYGAQITPQEQEILVKYAANHFGRR